MKGCIIKIFYKLPKKPIRIFEISPKKPIFAGPNLNVLSVKIDF